MTCSFSAVSMWVGVPLAPLAESELANSFGGPDS